MATTRRTPLTRQRAELSEPGGGVSVGQDNSLTKQVEPRTAEHLPLGHFDTAAVAFHSAAAIRQSQPLSTAVTASEPGRVLDSFDPPLGQIRQQDLKTMTITPAAESTMDDHLRTAGTNLDQQK